ncbi:hypothetical protein [Thiothrix nivea]|uniref:hypothetical protein n=1 Tax=Thiothrix nivea TaxID=1031 RepID=UPI000312A94A|nr:hypothetical protein [Thiothrix nivea]
MFGADIDAMADAEAALGATLAAADHGCATAGIQADVNGAVVGNVFAARAGQPGDALFLYCIAQPEGIGR